ncbi:MAG: hypothetical protein ACPL0C_01060 [Candidatus Bathyarchaeales archaeon]
MLVNKRAISTLTLIILLLCSAIFGAITSYLWVMASYYNMPEDMTLLIVTDVSFNAADATHFNVTILNPSISNLDVNISAIRLNVESKNETYDITSAEPSLPFLLQRGTQQTFKCLKNWGKFAGENVTVEPIVSEGAATKSYSYQTPNVKLRVTPNFNVSESVNYFNITVENDENSVTNVTISDIFLFGISIKENVTPSLDSINFLPINSSLAYTCNYNWEGFRNINVTVTVKTYEGYEATYTTNKLPGASLSIQDVKFDYSDTEHFYVNISSSEDSTADASIRRINVTLEDGREITINQTFPPVGAPSAFNSVHPNGSLTINCLWNWSDYRDKKISVKVYTNEGFTVQAKNVTTPPQIVWDITNVKFDLDYTNNFTVEVKNMLCSLSEINITRIMLNDNVTEIVPQFAFLGKGDSVTFNCTINWKAFIGSNVTITVIREDGVNISRTVEIPPVQLKMEKPAISELLGPYVNVTISNSVNSIQNVTITSIVFETENQTFTIDGTLTIPELVPDGYVLKVGENITIVCRWNWVLYLKLSLKVTVYTVEGFQISEVWYPPPP